MIKVQHFFIIFCIFVLLHLDFFFFFVVAVLEWLEFLYEMIMAFFHNIITVIDYESLFTVLSQTLRYCRNLFSNVYIMMASQLIFRKQAAI
jgi:hypothetical protein